MKKLALSRRDFVIGTSAVAGAALSRSPAVSASASEDVAYQYCTFIKYLQELSYEELASKLTAMGFDGAEVTVRRGGYIAPEAAADELPKLAEVFQKHDLKISIITTDIQGPDSPHAESILTNAAKLGVKRYRMGFCRYDLKAPIVPQLDTFKPQFKELAAMNREHKITGLYQNHAGAKYLGATFWDLEKVLRDIPAEEIGCIFDIRHAVAEGSNAWPIYYDIIKPHIAALSVKDFKWERKKETDKRLSQVHVPLGTGQVDLKKFVATFRNDFPSSLVTLHVEYLHSGGLAANLKAIENDFGVLKKTMNGP